MRIFIAGATGVIGRALVPRLSGHILIGMTRSRPELVRELGAEPAICDVYDRGRVLEVVAAARPEVVLHLLTDLAGGDFDANNRIRREGTRNLVDAAVAARARRLIVESVSFELPPEGAAARDEMERLADGSGLEATILRFDRLWGPHTWHEEDPNEPGRMHVNEAAEAIVAAIEAG
jgi:nucleoside-diphosphate-sugar epimerase